jgi:hypothetical protein
MEVKPSEEREKGSEIPMPETISERPDGSATMGLAALKRNIDRAAKRGWRSRE